MSPRIPLPQDGTQHHTDRRSSSPWQRRQRLTARTREGSPRRCRRRAVRSKGEAPGEPPKFEQPQGPHQYSFPDPALRRDLVERRESAHGPADGGSPMALSSAGPCQERHPVRWYTLWRLRPAPIEQPLGRCERGCSELMVLRLRPEHSEDGLVSDDPLHPRGCVLNASRCRTPRRSRRLRGFRAARGPLCRSMGCHLAPGDAASL